MHDDDFGDFDDDCDVAFPVIRVHELSEFVFCPRAGVIAHETAAEDTGEESSEPGPRLGGYWDYTEHRFTEEIQTVRRNLLYWLLLTIPSVALILVIRAYVSLIAAAIAASVLGFVLSKILYSLLQLFHLVRERYLLRNAKEATVNFAPKHVTSVNWWALRKAGFECRKPDDNYFDSAEQIAGKPWRVLSHGIQIRVPVVRKHRGERTHGPQHTVRLMAYCHLLEICERADTPFGILMFAGSDECVVVPNTKQHRQEFSEALNRYRRFFSGSDHDRGHPAIPRDTRCRGCHLGKPRKYVQFESETVLDGESLSPMLMDDHHCTCGDRFRWYPPHKDIVAWQQRKREALE